MVPLANALSLLRRHQSVLPPELRLVLKPEENLSGNLIHASTIVMKHHLRPGEN